MPIVNGKLSLREWTEVHIDETIECLTGYHEDALYYNCTINKVVDCVLKNCCITGSTVAMDDMKNCRNVTMTLDCNHFADVEYSETVFDHILLLLLRTKGNTEKRKKLIEVLGGKHKVAGMLKKIVGD